MKVDTRLLVTIVLLLVLAVAGGSLYRLFGWLEVRFAPLTLQGMLAALVNVLAFIVPVSIYRRPSPYRVVSTSVVLWLLLIIFAHLSWIIGVGLHLQTGRWLSTPYFYTLIFLWGLTAYSWYHFSHKYLSPFHWGLAVAMFILLSVLYLFSAFAGMAYVLPLGFGLASGVSMSATQLAEIPVYRSDILDDL